MNRIIKTVGAICLCLTTAFALDLQFGGYLQNSTTLIFDESEGQVIADVNTARLEGIWDFAQWGGVEMHVLLSGRLAPLDPFQSIRSGSVMDRALQQVFSPILTTLGELEQDSLDKSYEQLKTIFAGVDIEGIIKYLPYSSFYPSDKLVLDRALVKIYFKPLDLFIGRQTVSWGTGYAFNPTDVWNRKNPLDPDAPNAGVNAFRMEIPLGALSGISFVGLPGRNFVNSSAGVRLKTNVSGYDLSLCGMRIMNSDRVLLGLPRKFMVGADLAGQIGEVGVVAEATLSNPLYSNMSYTDFDSAYVQAVVGMNYTFKNGLYAMSEYYYNGLGQAKSVSYSARDLIHLLAGEMPGFGRHYLFGGVKYSVNSKLNLTAFALGNLVDSSVMVLPSIEYSTTDNITMELGAPIGFGSRSRSEYGGVYPSVLLSVTGFF